MCPWIIVLDSELRSPVTRFGHVRHPQITFLNSDSREFVCESPVFPNRLDYHDPLIGCAWRHLGQAIPQPILNILHEEHLLNTLHLVLRKNVKVSSYHKSWAGRPRRVGLLGLQAAWLVVSASGTADGLSFIMGWK